LKLSNAGDKGKLLNEWNGLGVRYSYIQV